eukprot:TRINITY_DN17574_c0_g1_i1.p1 TRINITY_DN17574_c0_g1~~TRINITY_DN17574_c0_g1_i1.p1  ORF type:complete len:558 (+),score=52.79 TRINITY_DN17574_c0_g1_i1:35-1708(+)
MTWPGPTFAGPRRRTATLATAVVLLLLLAAFVSLQLAVPIASFRVQSGHAGHSGLPQQRTLAFATVNVHSRAALDDPWNCTASSPDDLSTACGNSTSVTLTASANSFNVTLPSWAVGAATVSVTGYVAAITNISIGGSVSTINLNTSAITLFGQMIFQGQQAVTVTGGSFETKPGSLLEVPGTFVLNSLTKLKGSVILSRNSSRLVLKGPSVVINEPTASTFAAAGRIVISSPAAYLLSCTAIRGTNNAILQVTGGVATVAKSCPLLTRTYIQPDSSAGTSTKLRVLDTASPQLICCGTCGAGLTMGSTATLLVPNCTSVSGCQCNSTNGLLVAATVAGDFLLASGGTVMFGSVGASSFGAIDVQGQFEAHGVVYLRLAAGFAFTGRNVTLVRYYGLKSCTGVTLSVENLPAGSHASLVCGESRMFVIFLTNTPTQTLSATASATRTATATFSSILPPPSFPSPPPGTALAPSPILPPVAEKGSNNALWALCLLVFIPIILIVILLVRCCGKKGKSSTKEERIFEDPTFAEECIIAQFDPTLAGTNAPPATPAISPV